MSNVIHQDMVQKSKMMVKLINFNDLCHLGALCGSCGSNTTVTVLRMQCLDDCGNGGIFFIATGILGMTLFVLLCNNVLGFFAVFMDVVVIVFVLLASMKLSIPLPHSLRAVLFYVQVDT